MAADASEDTPQISDAQANQPSPSRKFGFGGKKFKILALLLVVMSAQAAAMYLLLPQPTAETAQGEGGIGPDAGRNDASESEFDTVEIKIDSFNSTNSNSPDGGSIHVSFVLYATVASDVQFVFNDAISSHKARVSQAIIKVIRMSSREDLRDPELNVVKRRIKEGVNKVLRKSYIKEVVISEFKTMEQ